MSGCSTAVDCVFYAAVVLLAAAGCVGTHGAGAGLEAKGAPPRSQVRQIALASRGSTEIVRSLTDEVGPRPAGSAGYQAAVEWALRTLRERGFSNVRAEPVTVPHWERGEESAVVLSPVSQRLQLAALGGGIGGGGGGDPLDRDRSQSTATHRHDEAGAERAHRSGSRALRSGCGDPSSAPRGTQVGRASPLSRLPLVARRRIGERDRRNTRCPQGGRDRPSRRAPGLLGSGHRCARRWSGSGDRDARRPTHRVAAATAAKNRPSRSLRE